MIDEKVAQIRSHLSRAVGTRLIRYETAELLSDDGTWIPYPDLPIRLYTDSGDIVAIAWSHFDTLWIGTGASLPFRVDGLSVRWVSNSIERINPAIGAAIRKIMIGRGEMTVGGHDVEVWTRLLIQLGDHWLEIFNALDENAYYLHSAKPPGTFIACL